MSRLRRRSAMLLLALVAAFLVVVPAVSAPSRAEIGAGSRLHVKTQTQMLYQQGGGYVTWEISGPVVQDIRRNIDSAFGDGDGNVTEIEGTAFTSEMDSNLENNIFYGCARIMRSALLTKVLDTSTDGLLGPVNDTRGISIRFYFNADLRTDGADMKLGDTTIPLVVIRALRGDPNRTFAGELDWEHQEIMVGFASFSRVEMDKGSLTRLRAPGAEIFWFHLALTGNQSSQDRIGFETFDAAQSPRSVVPAPVPEDIEDEEGALAPSGGMVDGHRRPCGVLFGGGRTGRLDIGAPVHGGELGPFPGHLHQEVEGHRQTPPACKDRTGPAARPSLEGSAGAGGAEEVGAGGPEGDGASGRRGSGSCGRLEIGRAAGLSGAGQDSDENAPLPQVQGDHGDKGPGDEAPADKVRIVRDRGRAEEVRGLG
jgi:hypothetical protein